MQDESTNPIYEFLKHVGRPFVAGLLSILPLALTFMILAWLVEFLQGFIGPESMVGRVLGSFGLTLVASELGAYLIGVAVVLVLVYALGVLVEAGMKNRWTSFVDGVMRRLPLVNTIYNAAKQVMAMFAKKDESALQGMRPVLCHFGGEGGTALLALLPSPEIIQMNGRDFRAVLIPTAPVPFGGGLFYVPAEWIKPVDFGVDGLLNVYMSMGVTSPHYLKVKPMQPPKL